MGGEKLFYPQGSHLGESQKEKSAGRVVKLGVQENQFNLREKEPGQVHSTRKLYKNRRGNATGNGNPQDPKNPTTHTQKKKKRGSPPDFARKSGKMGSWDKQNIWQRRGSPSQAQKVKTSTNA